MEKKIAQPSLMLAGSPMNLLTEYLTAGEGPPLLLLHGVGDSADSWKWVIPALAKSYRVYAPSLPGFGGSAKPNVEYSSEFYTSFLTAFLDTLGLQQVSFVGNSLGGLVGIRLALATPERVKTLVLVDSAGLGREVNLIMRLQTLPGAAKMIDLMGQMPMGGKIWAKAFCMLTLAKPNRAKPEWFEGISRMAKDPGYNEATVSALKNLATLAGQRDHQIMLNELSRLTPPTLIIWGEQDRILPVRQAKMAISRLKEGRLEVLSDCGHIPQIEQPERFQTVLSQFLEESVPLPQH
ncbi:alpha/beta fold hydrolase [Gloeothece verrucosa]|uniref:Alpha/beta hydrolase fold protein n=1 Tax=Gloeothece verrucosa (strain PCC 7822) TaxID=497965 RepID=E0UFW8_GLOV7|nr:alpha/beta fold hydrolase [Gloeothece verrucosa]ADN14351.1 alpha/beta hydrolase fold protein [Gloeothece verrucosa PCC 7822]